MNKYIYIYIYYGSGQAPRRRDPAAARRAKGPVREARGAEEVA